MCSRFEAAAGERSMAPYTSCGGGGGPPPRGGVLPCSLSSEMVLRALACALCPHARCEPPQSPSSPITSPCVASQHNGFSVTFGLLRTPAGADAMRCSTSGVSTQTVRVRCGVPVSTLRAPAQAVTPHHHYFTAAQRAEGRYRPIQRRCHRAGACRSTPTHSDIMFVRQPSYSPSSTANSPRPMRYSPEPEWAGRRALGAVARTGPQGTPAPDLAEVKGGDGASWSAPRPSAQFCGCPHKRHYAVQPSGGAPIPLADARKGPRQHTGHSPPSCLPAGWTTATGRASSRNRGPHNATPLPGSRRFPDGAGSLLGRG